MIFQRSQHHGDMQKESFLIQQNQSHAAPLRQPRAGKGPFILEGRAWNVVLFKRGASHQSWKQGCMEHITPHQINEFWFLIATDETPSALEEQPPRSLRQITCFLLTEASFLKDSIFPYCRVKHFLGSSVRTSAFSPCVTEPVHPSRLSKERTDTQQQMFASNNLFLVGVRTRETDKSAPKLLMQH